MQKKVEILSEAELFCTSEDGLTNVVSFVKYNLTVNSLMLLEMTRCVLYKNAYTPDDKDKGYNVIEAADVTSLWRPGEGAGMWGAAAPSGYYSVNCTGV